VVDARRTCDTAGIARIFELRTYQAAPGKLDALHARFRDHTVDLFKQHGLEVVGFWVHGNAQSSGDGTLVYLLAFDSRADADAAWEAFRTDPEWIRARAESEEDGILTAGVQSVFMEATDYSPLK
jgi:NIPSNAP